MPEKEPKNPFEKGPCEADSIADRVRKVFDNDDLRGGHESEDPEKMPSRNYGQQTLPSFEAEVEGEEGAIEITPVEGVPVIIEPGQLDEAEAEEVSQVGCSLEAEIKRRGGGIDQELKDKIEAALKEYKHKQGRPHCNEHDVITLKGKHLCVPEELAGVLINGADWEKLVKVFDGTILTPAELGKQAPIWINYPHIFRQEMIVNCKKGERGYQTFIMIIRVKYVKVA